MHGEFPPIVIIINFQIPLDYEDIFMKFVFTRLDGSIHVSHETYDIPHFSNQIKFIFIRFLQIHQKIWIDL